MTTAIHFPMRLPSDLLGALGERLGLHWSSPDLEPFICKAVEAWLKPAAQVVREAAAAATQAGYQWKQVFLPEGTMLRASFKKQAYFATVEDSEIRFDETALSPSAFANLRGSGNRNAWKAVWLRFPGSDAWVRADVCRTEQRAATTRMFGGGAGVDSAGKASRTEPPPRPETQPAATGHCDLAQGAETGGKGVPAAVAARPSLAAQQVVPPHAAGARGSRGKSKGKGRRARRKHKKGS